MSNFRLTLNQYSVLSTGLMALHTNTNAQAVFTDLDPDILVFEDVFENEPMKYFDFNGDGLDDVGILYSIGFACGYCPYNLQFSVDLQYGAEIAFTMAPPLSLWSTFQSSYSSSVGECQIPSHAVARGFHSYEVITTLADFTNLTQLALTYSCGSNGDFGVQNDLDFWDSPSSPATKPFIAFRFNHEGETHLGWLRLYAGDDDKIWVTHMGYQLTPGASLEMSLRTLDIALEPVPNITAGYQSGNFILVNNGEPVTLQQISIYSITGALVYTTSNTSVAERLTIPLDVAGGMYIVQWQIHDANIMSAKCIVSGN